jgi:hypothetical protein
MAEFEEFCAFVLSVVAIIIFAVGLATLVIWLHGISVAIVPGMIIGAAFGMVYFNRKV